MSPKRKSMQRRMKRSARRSARRMKRSVRRSARRTKRSSKRSARRSIRRMRRSARRSVRRSRRSDRRSVRRARRSARRSVRRSRRSGRRSSRMKRGGAKRSKDSRHCWYPMSGGAMRKRKSSMKRKSIRRSRRSRSKNGRRTGSRSKVRIPVTRQGALEGYYVHDPVKTKRKMLDWYVKKDGYSTVIKRLNVLAIYNKNRNPKLSKKVQNDISYLQKKYRM